jgi:hypothetical protein
MRALALIIVVTCLACDSRTDAPPEASAPSRTAPASSAALRSGGIRLVEAPPTGDVAALVRDAVARSRSDQDQGTPNGALVVYVGASWCEPCGRFHAAAERGELDSTLPGLTLLEFDLDRDRERLASANYVSKYIPLFALPGPDGNASGKQVEGGIKGDGAVGFIVPRLRALLAGIAP